MKEEQDDLNRTGQKNRKKSVGFFQGKGKGRGGGGGELPLKTRVNNKDRELT